MLKFNNRVLNYNTRWLAKKEAMPPIPSNTVRVRTSDGEVPYKTQEPWSTASYESATLVPGTADVYDVYKSGTNFNNLLRNATNVIEVLGANTTGITSMNSMFNNCPSLTTVLLFDTSSCTDMGGMFNGTSLTSVPLFDTSNVTSMAGMFNSTSLTSVPLFDTSNVTYMGNMFSSCTSLTSVPLFNTSNVTSMGSMFSDCTSLTSVPLFDTSSVTDMMLMFSNCSKVQSGALALYQQASSQATPPSSHSYCFYNCGKDTVTGAAELAQIPSDWK